MEVLFVEDSAFSTHHVQEDSVLGVVPDAVRLIGPVLAAEAPRQGGVLVFSPLLGGAVILCIEEDDVHAHVQRRIRPEARISSSTPTPEPPSLAPSMGSRMRSVSLSAKGRVSQ